MDDLKEFFGLTNIIAQYPFLEKLVLLGIVIVFASRQVKSRFKKIDEDRAKDEIYKKEQTAAMTGLTKSIEHLSTTMVKNSEETNKRLEIGDGRMELLHQQNLNTSQELLKLGNKMVMIETRLQLIDKFQDAEIIEKSQDLTNI